MPSYARTSLALSVPPGHGQRHPGVPPDHRPDPRGDRVRRAAAGRPAAHRAAAGRRPRHQPEHRRPRVPRAGDSGRAEHPAGHRHLHHARAGEAGRGRTPAPAERARIRVHGARRRGGLRRLRSGRPDRGIRASKGGSHERPDRTLLASARAFDSVERGRRRPVHGVPDCRRRLDRADRPPCPADRLRPCRRLPALRDPRGAAVGEGGRASPRPLPRPARPWPVPHHPDRRLGQQLRGPAGPRDRASRAETALTRDTVPVNVDAIIFWVVWNAEKAILEVENFTEAIDAERADGAARVDRPPRAGPDDHRARDARPRAAADPRREDQPVGHHRAVGRDPRRQHPEGARGRDVAPRAGRARAPGAHHPRHGGDGDLREVRPGGGRSTRTSRSRCTCAP